MFNVETQWALHSVTEGDMDGASIMPGVAEICLPILFEKTSSEDIVWEI
jgi:hypothetical protein